MIMFQRDGAQVKEDIPPGSVKLETDFKGNLHIFKSGRERYCNSKFSKVDSLKKGGQGPTVRKKPVSQLTKLRTFKCKAIWVSRVK